MISEQYVETIIRVAEEDASIARVLREICALSGDVRAGALELVGAHLRTQAASADVLQCVLALREDARVRLARLVLGPPSG